MQLIFDNSERASSVRGNEVAGGHFGHGEA